MVEMREVFDVKEKSGVCNGLQTAGGFSAFMG